MMSDRQEESMTRSNKTKLLQARVTPQTHDAITKLAEKYGVPRCQIVRWAVHWVLKAYTERTEASDEAR